MLASIRLVVRKGTKWGHYFMQPIIIRETAQTISCHLHINPTILSHCICGLYRRGDKGHQEASWPSRVGRSVLWAGFHSRTLPASSLSHSISCFNTESKLPITEMGTCTDSWCFCAFDGPISETQAVKTAMIREPSTPLQSPPFIAKMDVQQLKCAWIHKLTNPPDSQVSLSSASYPQIHYAVEQWENSQTFVSRPCIFLVLTA